ncbi:Aminomethyltransferase, mitochondrial [Holothuria leucospilota]|uniref:Aminomethyltransferase n=1 Tax=Holothuria leucospilota TaxID=206669 RepID=A0A9Q1CL36_HOLLE|nr:Aminomethyltransferase, mitochondrial [Holothuria leucospilota]
MHGPYIVHITVATCSAIMLLLIGMCDSLRGALKKTALYDFHVEHGAKMVPFAGWSMPVQYKDGILKEHRQCREHAAIFDVSHMLQSKMYGKDRVKFIESLTVADVEGFAENTGGLSLLMNDTGGIIDDLIINKTDQDYLYIVSNAGCADKDQAHVLERLKEFQAKGHDVTFEPILDMALVAIQGQAVAKVLQKGVDFDLSHLKFMNTTVSKVFGIDCRVTRCGYTGEDGVEISVPMNEAVSLVTKLLNSKVGSVQLAGLGARDSLRLEAGLCLYGNDIDDSTTPVEANLSWTIAKRRRKLADFPGASKVLTQLKEKPERRRVGLVSSGAPARHGATILDDAGATVGEVTSGCPSPVLKKNIMMGYVPLKLSKVGNKVSVKVRNKTVPAEVVKMPFVPTNYYTPK